MTTVESPTKVNAMAKPDGGARLRAWEALEARGQVPTELAVAAQLGQWRARRKARVRQHERAKETAAADGERARAWIVEYRREHGVGPLWRELGAAMGWAHRRQTEIIRACRKAGFVRFEPGVERSLDTPGDTGGADEGT